MDSNTVALLYTCISRKFDTEVSLNGTLFYVMIFFMKHKVISIYIYIPLSCHMEQ